MNSRIVQRACIILALATSGCQTSPAVESPAARGPLTAVAWLAGAWRGAGDNGAITEEHWTEPAGGTMLGVNRTIRSGRTVFFEFLRIESTDAGEVVYHAAPLGRSPATPFRLVQQDASRLVFENPDHDFPQRIIYERGSGGGLMQHIEGVEAGQTRASHWRLWPVDPHP